MGPLPAPADDCWGENDNPRRYDAYAREYPSYRETSRDLIAPALPSADGGVADAAGGAKRLPEHLMDRGHTQGPDIHADAGH
jgi:hypothetical protein